MIQLHFCVIHCMFWADIFSLLRLYVFLYLQNGVLIMHKYLLTLSSYHITFGQRLKTTNKQNQMKFQKASVRAGKDVVNVKFSAEALAKAGIKIGGTEIYYGVVNGVIQLTGSEPKLAIPMVVDKSFTKQN